MKALVLVLGIGVVVGCGGHRAPPEETTSVIQAASAAGSYAYAFDRSGLMTSSGSGDASYGIVRHGSTLTAGTDTYTYDALGRVAAIDGLSIVYGPDGQIDRATSGSRRTSYVYDENGQRILESTNGAPTAAYVEGAYVSATELDEPVVVAGRRVGLLRDGHFALTASDMRGSVQADADGTMRLASPFGARPVHPDIAAAVDYADHGYDADLGTDRMGVRDYDARIGRFLEPDPHFLLHPEECVSSPAECNLYGYAKGSPASFTDPTGEGARDTLYNFAPHLFNVSIGVPFGSFTLSVGIKGDQAGTFYASGSRTPLTLSGWKAADWKHPFSMSVTASTILPRAGETRGPSAERVDNFATGPSLTGQGCYFGCAGATTNPSGTSVDYGIGIGIRAPTSAGLAGGGSFAVRLGNPTDALAKAVFDLFHPNWTLNTPAENEYKAAHEGSAGRAAPQAGASKESP
jgi:RHS repeat-associated protein